jgi:hypothetical protein
MTSTPTGRPVATQPSPAVRPRHWSAGRVIGVVASTLGLLLGGGLLLTGGGLAAMAAVMRSDDGFMTTTPAVWASPGYAVHSEDAQIHRAAMMTNLPRRMMGTVKVTADAGDDRGVFVGLARTVDADRYLRGVGHSTILDPWSDDGPRDRYSPGAPPAVRPADAGFWVASSAGPGRQTVTWEPSEGRWTLVVMNTDGTAPVAADVTLAAELPVVNTVAATLIVAGVVVLIASGVGLWLTMRDPSRARAETRRQS